MDSYTALFDKTVELYIKRAGEVAMRRLPDFIDDLFSLYVVMGWDSWDSSKYREMFDTECKPGR